MIAGMNIDISQEKVIKCHLKSLLRLVTQYQHFLDTFIIEFFIEDHWKKVPEGWRKIFENMEPSEFSEQIFEEHPSNGYTDVLPLSLLAFKTCCSSFGVSRHYNTAIDMGEFNLIPCQSKMIDHVFRKHVKPKKQHEIRKLGEVIMKEMNFSEITRVVDVGAGHGHLSRLLALGYDIPVSSFELNAASVIRAKEMDDDCIKCIYKKNPHGPKVVPSHTAKFIEPFLTSREFLDLFGDLVPSEKILLTGLHACGDLSATMLHTFVNCEEVQSLVSISCCYMKLSTCADFTEESRFCGYPMSSYVRSIPYYHLSYKSRATACHANENFAKNLRTNGDQLRVHCCRSVLESLIRKSRPDMVRPGVQISQKIQLYDFEKYVKIAFEKISMSDHLPDGINGEEVKSMLSQWKKVIMYYSLSLLLAPMVETVILLDRGIYLLENGFSSRVECIFDPSLSPRCFALIANKISNK